VIRYYITDRKPLGSVEALLNAMRLNLERGVDLIQIREKDLNTRDLVNLVRRALALPNLHGTAILVNSRFDVAFACGAAGVHLPADSPSPAEFRSIMPAGFRISVSCHTIAEVRRAEREGADFVVFGPVFQTGDKTALGLEALADAARTASLPILALGGISEETAPACVAAGAAGIAGISMFQTGM
jgi:thiamine-phosphate pyrophosphorylase